MRGSIERKSGLLNGRCKEWQLVFDDGAWKKIDGKGLGFGQVRSTMYTAGNSDSTGTGEQAAMCFKCREDVILIGTSAEQGGLGEYAGC